MIAEVDATAQRRDLREARELTIIGRMLVDARWTERNRDELSPDMFNENRALARVILQHADEFGTAPELSIVLDQLQHEPDFQGVDRDWLARQVLPYVANCAPHVADDALRMLCDQLRLLRLQDGLLTGRIAAMASSPGTRPATLIDELETLIAENRPPAKSGVERLTDAWVDPATQTCDVIPTGEQWYDYAMPRGAMERGTMLVFVAPPKLGKSSLCLHLMLRALEANPELTGLWCRGEMSRERLQLRALQNLSGMADGLLRRDVADLSSRQRQQRDEGVARLHAVGGRLVVLPGPFTVEQIRGATVDSGAALVAVDYLQRMQPLRDFANRRESVDFDSQRLTEIAVDCNATILAISNMAKAAVGGCDILTAAKETSGIGFDCDALYVGEEQDQPPSDQVHIRWACKGSRSGDPRDLHAVLTRSTQQWHGQAMGEEIPI